MSTIKIELDADLLRKYFLEEVKRFGEELDEALGKYGFKTHAEKAWVGQLVLTYSLLQEVSCENVKDELKNDLSKLEESIPEFLSNQYITREHFWDDAINNPNNKNLKGLFFLAMARNNLDLSLYSFLEGDYHEGFSLSNQARKAFSLYQETLNRDKEKSWLARANAFKSHIETYELKKQAIDYWCENIDLKLSNEKAAELLTRIVPVSHRKLSQYVAEAKKKNIHPACKV